MLKTIPFPTIPSISPSPRHRAPTDRRVRWRRGGRGPCRGPPPVFLPAGDPAGDALTQILAIGVEVDQARLPERFERGDRRHQFHAVVGGVRLAALQFLFYISEFQNRAPSAGTRVARTCAVGMDGHGGK